MGLSIGNNPDSVVVQTNLLRTSQALSTSFERLSSGLRINSAVDDPGGLALADKLRADGKLATVAIRNANDGLSLTTVADSSLSAIDSMLGRMLELAQQSSNGTNTASQRSALSSEFLALGSEIDRIARTTTFNDFNLLYNSNPVTLQVGLDNTSVSRITLDAVQASLSSVGLASSGSSRLTFSIISTTDSASQLAATTAVSAVQAAMYSLTVTRGTVGASQSRLTYAINFLQVARENYVAAERQIRDVDVAEEVANMVRLQITQQAGIAVLAQANQEPESVLRLLS